MFVTLAKLAGHGLTIVRVTTQQTRPFEIVRLMLSPLKQLSRPFKPILTPGFRIVETSAKRSGRTAKNLVSESMEQYTQRVQGYFTRAMRELKIPKELEPSLVFKNLPINYGGAYHSTSHTIIMNQNLCFISKLFPGLIKKWVRHEAKHAQQFIDIARSGLNNQLPAGSTLPENIAKLAEALGPRFKTAALAQERLQQAINCIKVNKKKITMQKNLGKYLNRVWWIRAKKELKEKLPVSGKHSA